MRITLLIHFLVWMTYIQDCAGPLCGTNGTTSSQNTCYELITTIAPMTIADANRECEAISGRLATVYAKKDASQLTYLLGEEDQTRQAFVGLTKLKTGQFTWMDGSADPGNLWETGDPDNLLNGRSLPDISCAVVVGAKLRDFPCWSIIPDNGITRAICETGAAWVDSSFITDQDPSVTDAAPAESSSTTDQEPVTGAAPVESSSTTDQEPMTGAESTTKASSEFSDQQTEATSSTVSVYSEPTISKTSAATSVSLGSNATTTKTETAFATSSSMMSVGTPATPVPTTSENVISVSESTVIKTTTSAISTDTQATETDTDISSTASTIVSTDTQATETDTDISSTESSIATDAGDVSLVSSMGESSMTGNLQSQATETSLLVAAVQITPTAETLVTARTSLDNAITTVDASTQNTTLVKLSRDTTTNTIDTTENTESSVAEDLTPSSTGVGAVTTVTAESTTKASSEFSDQQTEATSSTVSVYSEPTISKTSAATSVSLGSNATTTKTETAFATSSSMMSVGTPATPVPTTSDNVISGSESTVIKTTTSAISTDTQATETDTDISSTASTIVSTDTQATETDTDISGTKSTVVSTDTQATETDTDISSTESSIATDAGDVSLVSSMGESSMTGNLQSQATETSLLVAAVQITPTAETLVTARTSLDNAITTVDASTQNTALVKLSRDRTTNTIDTTENTESSVAEDLTPSSTGVGAVKTVTLQETSANVIMLRTQVLNEATTTTSLLVPAIQITPTVETFVTTRTSLDHSINTVDVITQNTTPVESIVAKTSNVMAMAENTESTIVETPTPPNTDVGAVTTATLQETSTVTVPRLQTQTTNEQTTTNVPTKDAHVTTINGRYSTMTTKNKLPLRCWQRICPNKQATGTADFKRILKNETSKYRRRHISVNDERLSCAVMGFFGLSLLLALLLFFVVDDFKRMKDACLYNIHLKRPQKSTTKSSKVDSKMKIAGTSSSLWNSERH